MSRRIITEREVNNPELILDNLIADYLEGNLDQNKFLYRALVKEIDHEGGRFSENPPNPKNSIKGPVIVDGLSSGGDYIFWPFFPFDLMPIKESEHIYVIFEDEMMRDGFWLTRITEPNNVDNPNLTPGSKKYEEEPANKLKNTIPDAISKKTNDTMLQEEQPIVSPSFLVDKSIEKYKAKTGDRVIEGSNNTVIVLGNENQFGNIKLVSGDSNGEIDVSDLSGPSIIIKSDEIRINCSKDMKITVEGDTLLNGEPLILGDKLKQFLGTVGSVQTPAGPGFITLPEVVFSKKSK